MTRGIFCLVLCLCMMTAGAAPPPTVLKQPAVGGANYREAIKWADVTFTPTTLAGFGITDPVCATLACLSDGPRVLGVVGQLLAVAAGGTTWEWVDVDAAGTPGPPGADGATGATGPQGPSGAPGATGPTGPQGVAGAAGATGPTGPQGPAGADGAPGPTGPQGLAGSSGVKGDTGASGAAGPPGATGAAGAAGAQGPAGPQGLAGANGVDGATGAAGPTGPQGPTGAAGAPGAAGSTGLTGPQGPAGADGANLVTVALGNQAAGFATDLNSATDVYSVHLTGGPGLWTITAPTAGRRTIRVDVTSATGTYALLLSTGAAVTWGEGRADTLIPPTGTGVSRSYWVEADPLTLRLSAITYRPGS